MNVQQFRYALEIYRNRSMNKAAQSLYISQPALSQSIRELEKDLGFTIFERSSKGMTPTVEGYAFLNSIQDFVNTMERLQRDYSSGSDTSAVLRISSNRYTFVASAVLDFYEKHCKGTEHFSITFHEVEYSQVVDDVTGGRSDFGIIHIKDDNLSVQLETLTKKGIHYDKIGTSSSYIVVRKDHPLAALKDVTIADILQYPQVRLTMKDADPYDKYTGFNYVKYGDSKRNFRVDNWGRIYSIVARTDAVTYAITSRDVTKHYPQLVARPIVDDDMIYHLYIIHRADYTPGETAQDFVDIVKSYGHD